MRRAALLLLMSLTCCREARGPEAVRGDQPQDSVTTTGSPPQVGTAASGTTTISTAGAYLLEASEIELDRAKIGMSEEDFYVMADDLMNYRSAAVDYLEAHRIPHQRFPRGAKLEFMVSGETQTLDLSGLDLLDVLVLYDGTHRPEAIATVDVDSAGSFFRARP